MLDIKRIRTDFDAVAEKLATRGVDAAVLNEMNIVTGGAHGTIAE